MCNNQGKKHYPRVSSNSVHMEEHHDTLSMLKHVKAYPGVDSSPLRKATHHPGAS